MTEKTRTLTKDEKFEIQFLEGVIEKSPRFVEALISIGDLYTKGGFYEKGLKVDQKLLELRGHDSVILYNLACSYSLVGNLNASLGVMQDAFKNGYTDIEHLEKDSDLENLRAYKPFIDFLSKNKINA